MEEWEKERLERLAQEILDAERVYVLTGAGLGVASGLSTFRGAGGIWNNQRVEHIASYLGFMANPANTWDWYNERIAGFIKAKPNAGHVALAKMAELLPNFTLATQNVDSLHILAGSPNVLELHGNLRETICTHCEHIEPLNGLFDTSRVKHDGCEKGFLRPNIVWFGEDLDEETLVKAQQAGAKADIIIAAGTSAIVYPAIGTTLPYEKGCKVYDINPDPQLAWANSQIALGTEVALPYIVEMLEKKLEQKSTHSR